MTKSKIFFYFCLSFISGIFLNSVIAIPQLPMLAFLILGMILISVLWKHKKIVVVGFCLIFLVAGIWQYQLIELKIKNNELRKYNDLPPTFSGKVGGLEQNIILIGTVVKEPDVREKSVKLTIKPKEIEGKGKILVTTSRYPEYKYGDEVRITGKLEAPPVFEDFNYKDYLKKEGIYSVVYYSKVELLNRGEYKNFISAAYAGILFFKDELRQSIYSLLSPPQSSILGAMILGDKSRVSDEWKNKLNIAGVRHITAISGMHVAILTTILMTLLIGLGLWRGQAFYFTVVLITLFIVMTGLQPSAIRAGIMGGLFLLGQKIGRKSFSPRAIVMAAAIMLAINPLLLLDDVGFQLSFLAMIGIIYLLPIFQNWFRRIPNVFQFRSILAMTLSAQIFTLPILVYNFGYMSLVSPITNILIVPLLSYIIGFGFLFALIGIIWQTLGWILSFPCWFLLTYLTKIVDFFSQPWAAKTIENVHWFWLIISYLILGFITWRLNQREKLKFLNY